jgi:tetratricopeptide (TPR) repeat protein
MRLLIFALVSLTCSLPAMAEIPNKFSTELQAAQTEKAAIAISEGKPADAIKLVDPVIAAYDAEYSSSEKMVFCAANPTQSLLALGLAIDDKKDGVVLDETWCKALFIKGFSLIDVNQSNDALAFLKKASEMAPFNAHYMNEYAEWYKSNRRWQESYDIFSNAREIASYMSKDVRKKTEARSLRGMGFAMIELGKLDEAEQLFQDSLKLIPKHSGALNELEYIKNQRKK